MNTTASELRSRLEAALETRIPRALSPQERPLPEMLPTGIAAVDALTGGVPVGCLSEICGPPSSGRTSVLLSLLAECMRRDEICALVDAGDAFDPQSAANVGVDLARLLWVRCGGRRDSAGSHKKRENTRRIISLPGKAKLQDQASTRSSDALEQALKTTDLLLQAGGFGLVVLDLADIPVSAARRIPLTTWFRFRRVVENTSTALVVIEQEPHAKTCASLVMDLSAQQANWSETAEQGTPVGTHFGDGTAPVFRVNSRGVVIPFGNPVASSFELPQRWNTPPHARLLNAVHVHLQVTRSRGIGLGEKFRAQPVSFGAKSPNPALLHSPVPALHVSS
jgi:hypothetical protein